ncbi:MAG: putative colanic acid biosynthesis acetyltransferase [Planctomycetes bacterium]|jgi:putative colanic acid biosynthesis acetyltransferase WcaF|nr:putative colanic acid biosynthesis acetyltransferase [Planctomycetota bacterium]
MMPNVENVPTSSTVANPPSQDAAQRLVSGAPLSWRVRRLLWSILENTLYRYSFHTWSGWRAFLLRCFGAKIGTRCTIRRTSRVYYPWLLEMGDLSGIGDDVTVYNIGRIVIGERCTISQEAYLCAGTHDYTQLSMPLKIAPISIGADTWICARAFVYPGVTIGEGAVVAACAVATRDVPAWTVVAGNPARAIQSRNLNQPMALLEDAQDAQE